MKTIHQIYCTHCTYGTSALEQRRGEQASRVLGYSARAASMEREDLRRVYRTVERFLSYHLPADTPSEQRMRLSARSPQAPRRLFYHPSTEGLQILGQISYRQKDTSDPPRYGSYFAHVLVSGPSEPASSGHKIGVPALAGQGTRSEKEQPPEGGTPTGRKMNPPAANERAWSVLDALSLWGASWKDEDRPDVDFSLTPWSDFARLRRGRPPAIDERVLMSFLTTPCGSDFYDPQGVIPERWKKIPESQRQALLADTLGGLLEIQGLPRRESVLLVVEPSVAALVFYGVASLLPEGPIREAISFSTYEPNPEMPMTMLAATVFFTPATDLKAEVYRRGFVHHTFNGQRSERRHANADYSDRMVQRFASEGPDALRAVLAEYQAAQPADSAELVELARTELLVEKYLDPAVPIGPHDRPKSAAAGRFLARAVLRRLAGEARPRLTRLANAGKHLAILEAVGPEAGSPESQSVVQALLGSLSVQQRLALPGATSIKAEAVIDFVRRQRCFPPQCEELWQHNPALDNRPGERFIPYVLARLEPAVLAKVCRAVLRPSSRSGEVLAGVPRGADRGRDERSEQVRVGEADRTGDRSRVPDRLSRRSRGGDSAALPLRRNGPRAPALGDPLRAAGRAGAVHQAFAPA